MENTPGNFPFIESYTTFSGSHLPEFESLDRIDNRWFIFGTLTYAKTPPRPATQLANFIQLIDTLGQQNRSHPDLLHWFARVEYSPGKLYHLHFILGEERIKNGYDHPLSVEETCQFLKKHWGHGMAKVKKYDRSEDGVGYITKTLNTDKIGETLMSPKLKRVLKKLPHSDRRENEIKEISRHHANGRDPFITEVVIKMSRTLSGLSESLDTSSAVGRMVYRMLSTLAEFERDVNAERTRNALGHMRRCNRRISAKIPFGYTLADDGDTLLPNAHEQAAISRIVERRSQRMTLAAIAETMTTEGVKTREGGRWFPATIAAILDRQTKLAA